EEQSEARVDDVIRAMVMAEVPATIDVLPAHEHGRSPAIPVLAVDGRQVVKHSHPFQGPKKVEVFRLLRVVSDWLDVLRKHCQPALYTFIVERNVVRSAATHGQAQ